MREGIRYCVYVWLVMFVVASLARYLLPKRIGVAIYLAKSLRGVPLNVVAFWLILAVAAAITILRLLSIVGRKSI